VDVRAGAVDRHPADVVAVSIAGQQRGMVAQFVTGIVVAIYGWILLIEIRR